MGCEYVSELAYNVSCSMQIRNVNSSANARFVSQSHDIAARVYDRMKYERPETWQTHTHASPMPAWKISSFFFVGVHIVVDAKRVMAISFDILPSMALRINSHTVCGVRLSLCAFGRHRNDIHCNDRQRPPKEDDYVSSLITWQNVSMTFL